MLQPQDMEDLAIKFLFVVVSFHLTSYYVNGTHNIATIKTHKTQKKPLVKDL
jgi:hypothetical protein